LTVLLFFSISAQAEVILSSQAEITNKLQVNSKIKIGATEKAWLLADQPTTGYYNPDKSFRYNSAGNPISVQHVAIGLYQVFIPGMGTMNGSTHVTAYGGNHRCKPTNLYAGSLGLTIFVRCWDNGNLADGKFTLLFYKQNGISTVLEDGYVFANDPSSADYIPDPARQWNSKGGTNTIQRLDVGQYQITMPKLNTIGGTVLVTAFGWGSERCKVVNWAPRTQGTVIRANCFAANGSAVDTRFTISYMSDVIMGEYSVLGYFKGAYVWANSPTNLFYTPSATYQHNNATIDLTKIIRYNTGAYEVGFRSLPGSDSTSSQVTAYGRGNEYCNIDKWYESRGRTLAYYQCYSNSGLPVDSKFTATYLTNERIPLVFK